MKTILTAIDFSGASESVVGEAVALARSAKDRIVLLTVVQPPVVTGEYAPLVADLAAVAAAGEKTAERHLSKLQKRLNADRIPNEIIQVSGAPVPNILAQAREHGADYIVMGSHGHTALYDLLVGSTTHGVLLRAHCPVVIVPSPKTKSHAPRKAASRRTPKSRAALSAA